MRDGGERTNPETREGEFYISEEEFEKKWKKVGHR